MLTFSHVMPATLTTRMAPRSSHPANPARIRWEEGAAGKGALPHIVTRVPAPLRKEAA